MILEFTSLVKSLPLRLHIKWTVVELQSDKKDLSVLLCTGPLRSKQSARGNKRFRDETLKKQNSLKVTYNVKFCLH